MFFTKENGKTPVALFSKEAEAKLRFKEEFIPPLPFKDSKRQSQRKNRQLLQVDVFLTDQLKYIPLIEIQRPIRTSYINITRCS